MVQFLLEGPANRSDLEDFFQLDGTVPAGVGDSEISNIDMESNVINLRYCTANRRHQGTFEWDCNVATFFSYHVVNNKKSCKTLKKLFSNLSQTSLLTKSPNYSVSPSNFRSGQDKPPAVVFGGLAIVNGGWQCFTPSTIMSSLCRCH